MHTNCINDATGLTVQNTKTEEREMETPKSRANSLKISNQRGRSSQNSGVAFWETLQQGVQYIGVYFGVPCLVCKWARGNENLNFDVQPYYMRQNHDSHGGHKAGKATLLPKPQTLNPQADLSGGNSATPYIPVLDL